MSFMELDAISERNGILVLTQNELSLLKDYDDYVKYMNMPFIIINSTMTEWTLYENIIEGNVFTDHHVNAYILTQQANCSCFGNDLNSYNLCKEYVSTFLYQSHTVSRYEYWYKFENDINANMSAKYKECVLFDSTYININELRRHDTFNYHGVNQDEKRNKNNSGNYTKYYTYFSIFQLGMDSYNFLDHISLSP
eukprot:307892_1